MCWWPFNCKWLQLCTRYKYSLKICSKRITGCMSDWFLFCFVFACSSFFFRPSFCSPKLVPAFAVTGDSNYIGNLISQPKAAVVVSATRGAEIREPSPDSPIINQSPPNKSVWKCQARLGWTESNNCQSDNIWLEGRRINACSTKFVFQKFEVCRWSENSNSLVSEWSEFRCSILSFVVKYPCPHCWCVPIVVAPQPPSRWFCFTFAVWFKVPILLRVLQTDEDFSLYLQEFPANFQFIRSTETEIMSSMTKSFSLSNLFRHLILM